MGRNTHDRDYRDFDDSDEFEQRKRQRVNHKKKKKKKNKAARIILTILVLIIVFLGCGLAYFYATISGMKRSSIDENNLGIDSSTKQLASNTIKNIALLGVDSFDNAAGRSDAVVIATVDTKHHKIKLTSILRDSYVNIEGHGYDKLTHACAFGGPQLSTKTLNENFGLDITDYIKVDFTGMAKVIDSIGGLDINVKAGELPNLNEHIRNFAKNGMEGATQVASPGQQHLNGAQSVAYCRIRYTTDNDSDYGRTSRHREVLNLIFKKVKAQGIVKLPGTIKSVTPYVETTLSNSEILTIGASALLSGMGDIQQERFPLDRDIEDKPRYNDEGGQCVGFDENATKEAIQNYIFNDVTPPKNTVGNQN